MSNPPTVGEGWIEWAGGENPVPGRDVVVRFRDGDESEALDSRSFDWSVPFLAGVPQCDIIAYRVVSAPLDGPEALGSSSQSEDTHRAADGAVLVLQRIVSSDDDAKKNPLGGLSLGGLMDARDNSGCVYQSQFLSDALAEARAMIAATQQPAGEGEGLVGAAEREVGRAVYERIEHLIGGDSPELAYLAEMVACVEEYGSYSGPTAPVESVSAALMAAQSFIADGGLAEREPGASVYRQITAALSATQRPVSEGVEIAGPGGWLVKDFADGWYWTGDRLNADMAANGGACVYRIDSGEYETNPIGEEKGHDSSADADTHRNAAKGGSGNEGAA